jgi:hypothetical protein
MGTTWRRSRHRRPCAFLLVLFAASLGVCAPARGEILRMVGDVSQELDVLSPTPVTFEFAFPDNVIDVQGMRAWVTGKQVLGTFVTMDGDVRKEVPGGTGLAVTVEAACGGTWQHRSEILPPGMWDYDATFTWNDEGTGCAPDLNILRETPFTATALAFPEYESSEMGWWQPAPAFYLVAVLLEFDVEYAVPTSSTSWSGIKSLYH